MKNLQAPLFHVDTQRYPYSFLDPWRVNQTRLNWQQRHYGQSTFPGVMPNRRVQHAGLVDRKGACRMKSPSRFQFAEENPASVRNGREVPLQLLNR